MTLDKSHWAVRYYVFLLKIAGNGHYEIEWHLYRVGDLCQFVRALALRTIALVVMTVVLGAVLSLIGLMAYSAPLATAIGLSVALLIVGFIALVGAAIHLLIRRIEHREPRPPGLIRTYIRAVKRGICPLIKIENTWPR